jgi:hypothetical protein
LLGPANAGCQTGGGSGAVKRFKIEDLPRIEEDLSPQETDGASGARMETIGGTKPKIATGGQARISTKSIDP